MERPRYEAVVWDFDGTLVDTSPGIFQSVKKALAAQGFPEPGPQTLRKFVGPPLMLAFQAYTGLTERQAEQAVWDFRRDYQREGVYRSAVYDGIPELLGRLRRCGVKLGVATLKPEHMARLLLDRYGLAPLLDACVGSSEDELGGLSKARMAELVLERLGCADRSRAVLVGDTAFDAEGAREAGLDFIGVGYGFGIAPEQARELGCLWLARGVGELGDFLFGGDCIPAAQGVK